jgi:hypothetical protein
MKLRDIQEAYKRAKQARIELLPIVERYLEESGMISFESIKGAGGWQKLHILPNEHDIQWSLVLEDERAADTVLKRGTIAYEDLETEEVVETHIRFKKLRRPS